MFYNIINNAVKNTSGGGTVIIKIRREEKIFRIDISDTGKGIAQENMATLFSRFKIRTDEASGTGIGLAIAKSIADFHGIEIKAESILEKGTTFSFFIH